MVLGFQVFNETKRSPNERINFIKPLEGPEKEIAMDFLERVAAMMNPIMKEHSLVVMSLDEFPANREFWGRNFNNGACIQLVLKDLAGQWLSFTHVLGVMIHELAHNTHMNHSRAFHALRNKYAGELAALRARGYTGEGFWGTGRTLLSGSYVRETPLAQELVPEHLCGGTFREPKAKKKTHKRKLTYKEKEQRRIQRKFGTSEGNKVGGDNEERKKLEGKDLKAPPRVAKSKRGRELRAAAALKRLEEQQREQIKGEEEFEYLVTTEDEEDEKTVDVGGKEMVPVSGASDSVDVDQALEDEMFELTGCSIISHTKKGNAKEQIFKSEKKPNIKKESDTKKATKEPTRKLAEAKPPSKLMTFQAQPAAPPAAPPRKAAPRKAASKSKSNQGGSLFSGSGGRTLGDPSPAATTLLPKRTAAGNAGGHSLGERSLPIVLSSSPLASATRDRKLGEKSTTTSKQLGSLRPSSCPVCTTENPHNQLCCLVCGCVLRQDLDKNSWRCRSSACKDGSYLNLGDYGVCGVCGEKKG